MSGWEIAFGWINIGLTLGGLITLIVGATRGISTAQEIYKKQKGLDRKIEKNNETIAINRELLILIGKFRSITASLKFLRENPQKEENSVKLTRTLSENFSIIEKMFIAIRHASCSKEIYSAVYGCIQPFFTSLQSLVPLDIDTHSVTHMLATLEKVSNKITELLTEFKEKLVPLIENEIEEANENIDQILEIDTKKKNKRIQFK